MIRLHHIIHFIVLTKNIRVGIFSITKLNDLKRPKKEKIEYEKVKAENPSERRREKNRRKK